MHDEAQIEARIAVRQPREQDGESVGRFLGGLSPTSRYHRFFAGIHDVTPDLVEAMVAVTPGQFVLLALDRDNVVGHVMATHIGEDSVEIGIVVAEAYQHRGIGRKLVHELAETLAACGPTQVCCVVLSENYSVLDWLRRLLLDIRFERNGAMMTVHGTFPAHANIEAHGAAWTGSGVLTATAHGIRPGPKPRWPRTQ